MNHLKGRLLKKKAGFVHQIIDLDTSTVHDTLVKDAAHWKEVYGFPVKAKQWVTCSFSLVECDHCDGVGTVEGGKTIGSCCKYCSGAGTFAIPPITISETPPKKDLHPLFECKCFSTQTTSDDTILLDFAQVRGIVSEVRYHNADMSEYVGVYYDFGASTPMLFIRGDYAQLTEQWCMYKNKAYLKNSIGS
jgi:hypothetical protein